jgi:hypothetical protein
LAAVLESHVQGKQLQATDSPINPWGGEVVGDERKTTVCCFTDLLQSYERGIKNGLR